MEGGKALHLNKNSLCKNFRSECFQLGHQSIVLPGGQGHQGLSSLPVEDSQGISQGSKGMPS